MFRQGYCNDCSRGWRDALAARSVIMHCKCCMVVHLAAAFVTLIAAKASLKVGVVTPTDNFGTSQQAMHLLNGTLLLSRMCWRMLICPVISGVWCICSLTQGLNSSPDRVALGLFVVSE